MRTINIDGRLGRDAEVKVSPKGDKYVKFSVANTMKIGGKEDTIWFNVVSFDPRVIERQFEYLKKGSGVYVSGPLTVSFNIKEGKPYLNYDIRANAIEFPSIGKKPDNVETNSTFTSTVQTSSPNLSTMASALTADYVVKQMEQPAFTANVNVSSDDDELPF